MAIDHLITAFLKGTCSAEELKELRLWLSLPENKDKADALFKMKWKEVSDDDLLTDFNTNAVFQGIKATIRKQEGSEKRCTTIDRKAYEYPKRKKSWTGVKVILSLALVFTLGYLLVPRLEVPTTPQVEQFTKTAPRGYRNTITLIDGSIVTLNSESSITYDENFGKENRTIFLTGEAFFKVAHDTIRPFIVMAKNLKTTALGTSFNVNAYEENNTAISLAKGKVRVELSSPDSAATDGPQVILIPGEQAVWKTTMTNLIKREFDIGEILSWKSDIIYFNNTPLQSMVRVLEKWYDVQITIKGNTNKLTHNGTGKFKNKSLENVLSSLGYSMGFTYQINKKTITLKLTEE